MSSDFTEYPPYGTGTVVTMPNGTSNGMPNRMSNGMSNGMPPVRFFRQTAVPPIFSRDDVRLRPAFTIFAA